jgi:hypothetical protein
MTGERDPLGLNSSEPGAKLDLGKADMVRAIQEFPDALHLVGLVGDHGAAKYTEGGWRHVPNGYHRYTAAMIRHVRDEREGPLDPTSGLSHAAHAAWNALARLQLAIDRTEGRMTGRDLCFRVELAIERVFKAFGRRPELVLLPASWRESVLREATQIVSYVKARPVTPEEIDSAILGAYFHVRRVRFASWIDAPFAVPPTWRVDSHATDVPDAGPPPEAQLSEAERVSGTYYVDHPDNALRMAPEPGPPPAEVASCELCGEPMPPGEEMFRYHGSSGDCPKPRLRETTNG